MAPAVKRLLPPRSASGAASSMRTWAPRSCAASAAQKAAFPAPTTTTSQLFAIAAPSELRRVLAGGDARPEHQRAVGGARAAQRRLEPLRVIDIDAVAAHRAREQAHIGGLDQRAPARVLAIHLLELDAV